jgi:hypothetical protein
MPASGLVPSLSQVRAWDVEHLTDAARRWTRTATVWEDESAYAAPRPHVMREDTTGLAADTYRDVHAVSPPTRPGMSHEKLAVRGDS